MDDVHFRADRHRCRVGFSRAYLEQILKQFHTAGVRAIRLDAAGFAVKKPGTSCFMIPETFEFISGLTEKAHALGIEVLVEMHGQLRRPDPACTARRLGLRLRASAADSARAVHVMTRNP